MCSFVFIGMSVTFSQEKALSTEQPVQRTTSKSRSAVATQPTLTVEQIDSKIATLENVLVQNQNDATFNKQAVISRIAELKARKEELTK